ncbi:MAG: iron-containing alcohol dehydrogenase [Chloroflexi bacterium]|nr:iron-containing alcohol dehydrogenase [Chloroflexota bacterium]
MSISPITSPIAPFEFATAQRIIFGPGKAAEIGRIAAGFDRHALLVTASAARTTTIRATLEAAGVAVTLFETRGEPRIETANNGVTAARDAQADVIIAVGGGSGIDTGKAIAALATNPGGALEYVEVVGRGKVLQNPPLPFIAIPTTSGSGAEVTRNAVLTSTEHGVKASLRSPLMLPRVALVDPLLTLDLPPAATAATGMDALAQLIEPFVSLRANPFTDAFCREGLPRIARSLRTAYANGADAAAREDMSLASLLGGLALANSGLGAVHGFAAPIGGAFSAPHGAVCAALLPIVWQANVAALRQRAPHSPALPRYDELARILTGNPHASTDDGATWLFALRTSLAIPPLSTYGIHSADLPALVANAAAASSMQANPIRLTEEELRTMLRLADSGFAT